MTNTTAPAASSPASSAPATDAQAPTNKKPHVGDLGYIQETGSRERQLGIVTGHNDDGTVRVHVFGTSHPSVNAGEFVDFTTTDDGNIPPAPPPDPPAPPPEAPRWS